MVSVWKTPQGCEMSTQNSMSIIVSTHDTTENLGNLQVDHRLGSEENGGKSNDQGKTRHNRVTVTKSFRYIAIDEESKNFTNLCSLRTI